MENLNVTPEELIEIIHKIKTITEKEYKGDFSKNILTIFNKLSTSEKKTLLRGVSKILQNSVMSNDYSSIGVKLPYNNINESNKTLMEDVKTVVIEQLHNNCNMIEEVKTLVETKAEIDKKDIEEFNKFELIKLKSWLIKVVSITMLAGFTIFVLMFSLTNIMNNAVVGIADNFINIFKLIFMG